MGMTAERETTEQHRIALSRVPTLIVAASALLVVLLASLMQPITMWEDPDPSGTTENISVPDDEEPQLPTNEPDAEDSPSSPSSGSIQVVLNIVGVLVLAVLVLGVFVAARDRQAWSWTLPRWRRRSLRTRDSTVLPEVNPSPIKIDVDAARTALLTGPPRNAIVACWMHLEADAENVGLQRLPAETSAEYARRVVAASSVSPEPINDLAELYREARFSSHELGDAHRGEANDALARVIDGLLTGDRIRS